MVSIAPLGHGCSARESAVHAIAAAATKNLAGDPDSVEPAVLEVLLSFQHLQLLHLLPDQQISSLGAKRADSPVRFPGSDRAGHLRRRPDRRSHRPQVRHLVLHSRGPPVHLGTALRESVLDRHSHGVHWPDSGVGICGHYCLCAGVASRQDRHGLRTVSRICLRHGWRRCGGAG